MKPEQFIRWFGIEDAKYLIEQNINCNDFEFSLDDLKRLVKSLGIIDELGGIEEVKRIYSGRPFELAYSDLGQAIHDHETIYGGGDETN
ncbi:hypothetical protein ABFO81_13030 [Acinetobacter baumannii]